MKLVVLKYGKNKYRFGITSSDFKKYFKLCGVRVIIRLSKTNKFEVNMTCNTSSRVKNIKKMGFIEGYNLDHEKIDNWIKSKGFDKNPPNEPKEITFLYTKRKNGDIVLIYPWDNLTTRFNPFNVIHRSQSKK